MSRTNALDTLNAMVIYQTKGLPYRNKNRIAILSRLSGNEIKSSLDIPSATVNELLEIYFPKWQEPDTYPPLDSQETIRAIAEQCASHLVEELGDFDEYIARLKAEQDARHAEKEAAKAERIRLHDEQQRIKKERQAKKQPKTESAPAALPTTRTRRIFG